MKKEQLKLIFLIICMFVSIFAYSQRTVSIPFRVDDANLLNIKVNINNGLTRTFIFDTGASGVSISSSVFAAMQNNGLVTSSDIIGSTNVVIANGSVVAAKIIRLRSLALESFVVHNVEAFVMPDPHAPLLIGQTIVSKFGKVSIDYDNNVIILEKKNVIASDNDLNINEVRFVPCTQSQQHFIGGLKKIINKSITVKKYTEETDLPVRSKAVNSISEGITIRYFNNDDYHIALAIQELLETDANYKNTDIMIENMLPFFNYKSIPSYIEIWIKE